VVLLERADRNELMATEDDRDVLQQRLSSVTLVLTSTLLFSESSEVRTYPWSRYPIARMRLEARQARLQLVVLGAHLGGRLRTRHRSLEPPACSSFMTRRAAA
jgi:hypothetical protein